MLLAQIKDRVLVEILQLPKICRSLLLLLWQGLNARLASDLQTHFSNTSLVSSFRPSEQTVLFNIQKASLCLPTQPLFSICHWAHRPPPLGDVAREPRPIIRFNRDTIPSRVIGAVFFFSRPLLKFSRPPAGRRIDERAGCPWWFPGQPFSAPCAFFNLP